MTTMRAPYPVILLAGIAMISQPVIAAEPSQSYVPSTPWNIHYADDSCVLRRRFGDPKHEILLQLRQYAPGDGFEVTVASEHVAIRKAAARIRFLPDDEPRSIGVPLRLIFPNKLIAASWDDSFFVTDPTEDAAEAMAGQPSKQRDESLYKARESTIRGLEINGIFAAPVALQTGEMHRSMSGMRKCLDELVTHWGIDAAAQKTLTRRTRPVDQMKWARVIQERYPSAMLNEGKGGRVLVRMIVGADGKPTSCNIQSIVEDLSFGQTACEGMMKVARFDPALDSAGKPIASYFNTKIIYTVN